MASKKSSSKSDLKNNQKAPEGTRPEGAPRPLDELDHLIIKMKIENPGLADTKLAKIFNISRFTIADRAKNPRFQMQIAELTKPAVKILKELQPIAALTLKRHLGAKKRNERGEMVDDVETQTKIALELSRPNLKQSVRVEHAGDPDNPVLIKPVRDLSDDELRSIIERDQSGSSRRITGPA